MASKKIKVKQGKTQSKIGFIVGILFFVLGVFVVIPTFGLFGLIWTGVVAMIAFTNYKNGFSDEGIATHEKVIEKLLIRERMDIVKVFVSYIIFFPLCYDSIP